MKRIIIIAVSLIVLLSSGTQVSAGDPCGGVVNTPYFTQYYGRFDPLRENDMVEAFSPRGDRVGCFVVHTSTYWGYMRVYGEDTLVNPPIPGMREGEEVRFELNGAPIHTVPLVVTWHNDWNIHEVWLTYLDLSPRQLFWLLWWLGIIP